MTNLNDVEHCPTPRLTSLATKLIDQAIQRCIKRPTVDKIIPGEALLMTTSPTHGADVVIRPYVVEFEAIQRYRPVTHEFMFCSFRASVNRRTF